MNIVVLDLAQENIRGIHIDTKNVRQMTIGIQGDQIVVGRHHAQFSDVCRRVTWFQRNHQGIYATDVFSESDSISVIQDAGQPFLKKFGVPLVSMTLKGFVAVHYPFIPQ
ncbi:hypothetical protein ACSSZE_14815 [Acidithiobacillus caldus]